MWLDLFYSWVAGRLKYTRPTHHDTAIEMFAQEGERKVSITCVDTKQRKLNLEVPEASLEERLCFRFG